MYTCANTRDRSPLSVTLTAVLRLIQLLPICGPIKSDMAASLWQVGIVLLVVILFHRCSDLRTEIQ